MTNLLTMVTLSDTHGLHWNLGTLPVGDVLVHAGDMCNSGSLDDLADFADWLDTLNYKHKIVVAGNHDRCLQDSPERAQELLEDRCIYLQDSSVEIDGVKFYGSPWQPEFCSWAFNLPRGGSELADKWASIPMDTDILITHCPPKGIRDRARDGTDCGCEHLKARVETIVPKYHIFGHIHEAAGLWDSECGTMFVNTAICTSTYRPTNPCHRLEVARDG